MRGLHQILLITGIYLISYSPHLLGQQYLHEPTIWKQYIRTPTFPWNEVQDYTLELNGDTVINGNAYFKILKNGFNYYIYNGMSFDSTVIYEYLDPIREENLKFYAYNLTEEEEYLLHDFDLSVGDTANTLYPDCENHIVTWIDTVYLGNAPRKRFHFGGGFNFVTLIEGVGTSWGLQYTPCNDFPAPYQLQCFVQDQYYIQFNSQVDCYSLVVVSTDGISEQEFTLYPTPFTDEINIQLPSSLAQPLHIVITNLLGTIIYQTQIDVSNEIETINPGNIPTGVYVVWLSSKDATSSFKILKL